MTRTQRRRGPFRTQSRSRARLAGTLGRAGAAACIALAVAAACRTQPRRPPPVEPPEPITAAPTWINQALSWQKLETLEAWLAHDAQRYSRELVIEATLQLNEGRILFAQDDLEKKSVPIATLRVRAATAKAGFAEVLADSSASLGARTRAQIGERAAIALLGVKDDSPGPLAIIARAAWGAKPARKTSMTPLKGAWSRITVHHSAEGTSDPEGGSLAESARTVRLIQKYHTEDPGHLWGDIGYHFLIDASGRIFQGRELEWQGAHAGGENNHQNIGVCLLGDLARRPPADAALKSLELLLDDLRARYRIQPSRIYAHQELSTTACPGSAMTAWIKRYRS
jgi:hypothetical protein